MKKNKKRNCCLVLCVLFVNFWLIYVIEYVICFVDSVIVILFLVLIDWEMFIVFGC